MTELIDFILKIIGLQPALPIPDPEPQVGPVIIDLG